MKKLKFLAIPFLLLFGLVFCHDSFATSITSLTGSQVQYTKNFDNTMQFYNWGNAPVPVTVLYVSNPTGVWDYSMQFSFDNPFTNRTGSGFTHTIYFTLDTVGDFVNENLYQYSSYTNLEFNGLNSNLPYCTRTFNIVQYYANSIRFMIQSSCPAGTFNTNQSYDSVLTTITYHPESLFWCANDSTSLCPSTFAVTMRDVDYYFEVNENSTDDLLQQQINATNNQTQIIIDQRNEDKTLSQQSSDDVSSASDDAQAMVDTGTTNLLALITTFYTAVMSAPNSAQNQDCTIPIGDLFHIYSLSANNLPVADICSLPVPPAVSVIATIAVIALIVPFAVALLYMAFNLLEGAVR